MSLHLSRNLSFFLGAALAVGSLVGCDNSGGGAGKGVPPLPTVPGPSDPGNPPDEPIPGPQTCSSTPACDSSVTVDSNGSALLVTDPAVLAEFPLEKVIAQISAFQGLETPPVEMVQRFFDTMNSESEGRFGDVSHCDTQFNPATPFETDKLSCPRAEGALADSEGFFEDGDADQFIPVAIVNRFDLTPIDAQRCGQYRIVYAKRSGLTDPNDRVFLIFEAALQNPNPGCLESCRPVAEFWAGLEGKSSSDIATHLRTFFFSGIPGFKPAVHPVHYGMGQVDQGYGGHEGGQIRVSMHMQDPWDMREMHFGQHPDTGNVDFVPATVKNNPALAMFDPLDGTGMGQSYRSMFTFNELMTLSAKELKDVQMFTSMEFNAGESALDGEKKNDYFMAATNKGDMTFVDMIDNEIANQGLNSGCPDNDPLDAEAILRRATVLSCAGCHAPKEFLGEDLSIGCGLTWPDTLGQSHITEKGEISPALKEVFLPHRAEVLQTFLQACDMAAIQGNLTPFPPGSGFEGDKSGEMDSSAGGGAQTKSLKTRGRTLGGSSTH